MKKVKKKNNHLSQARVLNLKYLSYTHTSRCKRTKHAGGGKRGVQREKKEDIEVAMPR